MERLVNGEGSPLCLECQREPCNNDQDLCDNCYLESLDAEDWDGKTEDDVCVVYLGSDGGVIDQDYCDTVEEAEQIFAKHDHAGQIAIIYSAPRTYTRLKVIRA